MSHSKERAEKDCLNCGAVVQGRYCQACGQENVEPKESAWGLVTHFFYDITHFDGKFFSTLGLLLRKPGFLSKEYARGRRASYLNPVRMYIFTSAFFFILFFSFFYKLGDWGVGQNTDGKEIADSSLAALNYVSKKALGNAKNAADSAAVKEGLVAIQRFTDSLIKQPAGRNGERTVKANVRMLLNSDQYRSVAHYDSLQKTLPPANRDGWLRTAVMHREIQVHEKIRQEGVNAVLRGWVDRFIHRFPQMLFVSLPLVALILQLLYIRKRKQFYYVNHAIFLVHIYVYSFINLLFFFIFEKIRSLDGWGWMIWFELALVFHAFWYVYKAMRNFYGQSRLKTFSKYLLLNLFNFILLVLVLSIFFIFTALII